MAGELVPLVLIPRYTTYAGAETFTTIGMEVTDYEKALVNVWRGPLAGGGAVVFTFEESTDGTTWSTCTGVLLEMAETIIENLPLNCVR